MDQYDVIDLASMSPQRVAGRALIMAALSCRGSIEMNGGQESTSLHQRLISWLWTLNLESELERSEEDVLVSPIGSLSSQEIVEATWCAEDIGVLAWALNVRVLPRHDETVDVFDVTDSVYLLSDDAGSFIDSATLRGRAELEAYRELVYAIQTRLREFLKNGTRKDFGAWVDADWIKLLGLDATSLIVNGDLGINGCELGDCQRDHVQECNWITLRRHKAGIWLLGAHPVYSRISVDT